MKKIIILANNDIGLYKFRKELIDVLVKQYEVHLVLPYGDFIDDLVRMGCIFHKVEFHSRGTNPIKDLKLLKQYKKIIRDIKPNAVLTYTIKPNVYGGMACAALKVPYIANITGLGTDVENTGVLSIITTILYKYALRKAKKVFFQNESNLEFMKNKKIVKDNYDLLPGSGVNLQQYQAIPYPNEDIIHFTFIARVMKEKGADQYLEAAQFISKKYPNTRFHICGVVSDEYKKLLEQYKDCVIYHGAVKNMLPIYAMTSCTIHPTYYPEGMSNVLLESCASARPIITTNRPGCKEILEDGVNGFLVKERDSADLIEKIETFLGFSYEQKMKMGLRGREKVELEFDRNIVVGKYVNELSKYGRI